MSTPAGSNLSSIPFTEFVYPEGDRSKTLHNSFANEEEFPVVDLQAPDLGRQIDAAARNSGFFQLINHGVSPERIRQMQSVAKGLFDLPIEHKQRIKPSTPGSRLGYVCGGYGRRFWHEGFQVFDKTDLIKEFSDKLWPDSTSSAQSFRDNVESYTASMRDVGSKLFKALEDELGLQPGGISKYCSAESMTFRINYYPPCPEPALTLGMVPHQDKHMLTLLHQDDTGGLQILKNGEWLGLKPTPDALVVNVGDSLKVLSNDQYNSMRHRVVVNSAKPRMSMAYFMSPRPDEPITPAVELVDVEHPQVYRSCTFKELIAAVDLTRNQDMNNHTTYLDHFKVQV